MLLHFVIPFILILVANILPADPNPRGQRSKFIFLEKGNYECSNMVANILPQTSPDPPWGCVQKVKVHTFQNTVMLHFTFKGIVNEDEPSAAQTSGLEIILMGDINIDLHICSNNKWLQPN